MSQKPMLPKNTNSLGLKLGILFFLLLLSGIPRLYVGGLISERRDYENTALLSVTQGARLLDNVRSEARRLQDIAEKLLELASLETGDRVLQDEDFDLALLVDEVADAFATQARTLGVTITVESPESLPRRGERFLIWRALANLVQNALDFSPTGGRVTLRVTERGVEVTDEGPGIPEFAQMRVTERFFSMERPRTGRKSSGLGLSFVQEVMRIHRGELRIESGGKEPPSGTKSALNW
ncbi:MAG: hypothetical protein KF767_16620 [Bdellovibrionaceae bacterium]|nr:hypothetical protein [Pseudobdellovibrionaceae bacterium]